MQAEAVLELWQFSLKYDDLSIARMSGRDLYLCITSLTTIGIVSSGRIIEMQIMQLLKHDLKDLRNDMAREYRVIRKADRAKAQELFRRMRCATALTERSLQDNLMNAGADVHEFEDIFGKRS